MAGAVDVVFIDAAHDFESVFKDICAWGPKVKKGGLLCGHDHTEESVRRAVAVALPTAYRVVDSIWMYRV